MALIFRDTFSDSDGTLLQNHTPNTGTGWTRVWNSSGRSAEIDGNIMRSEISDASDGFIYSADVTYPSADYSVQADIDDPDSSDDMNYIIARMTDQDNFYSIRFNEDTLELHKKVSGSWTELDSDTNGGDYVQPGDTVKIEVIGTAIKGYIDGVEVLSATDSDLTSAGKGGFAFGGGNELENSSDDLASQEWDNFEIDNIGVSFFTKTHTTDASLEEEGSFTVAHTSDSLLREQDTKTHTTDSELHTAEALQMIGFETGGTEEAIDTSGTLSIQSSIKRTGDYALRANPTSSTGIYRIGGNTDPGDTDLFFHQDIGVSVWLYIADTPAADTTIFETRNLGTANIKVKLHSDGTLGLYNGATQLGSDSSAQDEDSWIRLELKVKYSTSTGTAAAAIDGTEFASASSLNIANNANDIRIGVIDSTTADIYFDDFFMHDIVDYPGSKKIFNLKPDGVGDRDDWAGTFAAVDEIPISEVDARTSATVDDRFTNAVEDISTYSIDGDEIAAIKEWAWWKSDDATGEAALLLRSGFLDIGGASINSTTSQFLASVRSESVSNSVWTEALVDDLEVGMDHAVAPAAGSVRAYAVGIMVAENENITPNFTATHTTNALLRDRETKTHTTSANLKKAGNLRTHTTNALLKKKFTKTHTTNSLKRKRLTKTHTANSLLRKRNTQSHTTNSLKRKRFTKTHTTSSFKRKRFTRTHTTNAMLRKAFTRTQTTDAFLRARLTVSHTTDSLSRKRAVQTHTTDTFLKAVGTAEHTTDSALKDTQGKQHTTDALLRAILDTEHTTDTVLRVEDDIEHTTDAFLAARATASHTADSNLRDVLTASHDTDSLLREQATATHSTDSLAKDVENRSHTTDSLLRASDQLTHDTDSNLREVIIVTHTTNASILGENAQSHNTNALLRAVVETDHTTDGFLLANKQLSHTTDSNLKKSEIEVDHTTDSSLTSAGTLTHDTDALLNERGSLEQATDALLRLSESLTHTVDGLLKKTFDNEHDTDALLRAESELAHTTDGLLSVRVAANHTTDSYIILQAVQTHSTDSSIQNNVRTSHTTDTTLAVRDTRDHTTDSTITNRFTQSHSTDSRLYCNPKRPTIIVEVNKPLTEFTLVVKARTMYNQNNKPTTVYKEC